MSVHEHDQHIPIEDLSAYADGAYLSASERQEIEQHLATCQACRDELASIRAVSSLLADLPEPELPRSFRLTPEDLEQRAPAKPEPIQPWILRHQSAFRYASLAAAVLLAVIVTIDLLPGDSDDADDMVTTMMDEQSVELDDERDTPEDAPAMDGVEEEEAAEPEMGMEEAAPEEDAAEPEADRDVVEDEAADAPAAESAPDAPAKMTDDPVSEPDEADMDEPALEPTPAPPEDEEFQERVTASEEGDGLSTLQLVAIGLATLTVALLIPGFIIPRWWSSGPK